jgi:hypothetical protein
MKNFPFIFLFFVQSLFLFCFTLHSAKKEEVSVFFFLLFSCFSFTTHKTKVSLIHDFFFSSHVFLPKTTAVIKIRSWDGTAHKKYFC